MYQPQVEVSGVVYEVTPLTSHPGHITVVHPLMLGSEYPKTYGHYHVPPHDETYTIKSGAGLVLIQKVDEAGLVDFKQVPVKAGDVYTVPAGFAHALVNTDSRDLVVEDDWDQNWAEHDYESVTRLHGLAYYIVRGEDDKPQIIRNRHYS